MMVEGTEGEITQEEDYVFRYPIIRRACEEKDVIRLSRSDFFRKQLQNILDVIIPCCGNQEVKIDGFKLMSDRNHVVKLFNKKAHNKYKQEKDAVEIESFGEREAKRGVGDEGAATRDHVRNHDCSYQNMSNAAFYEPTIEYIGRQLDSFLDLVNLENDARVVEIDGFRLRNLSMWVEHSYCDPGDMLGYMATRCNCACVFCYNNGCPSTLALVSPKRLPGEELKEIQTRLKYFTPKKKLNLFTTLGTNFEAFIHPHFREVLHEIREKSDKTIRLTTNGTTLTKDEIEYLSKHQPLHLDIALHSSSPERRSQLMHDQRPEIAISSLRMLKEAGIVYDIVIVPWPMGSLEEMLDDMEDTIAYAYASDVRLIQISLPGYSKYFSEKELFNRDVVWEAITKRVREARNTYETPIVVRPSIYEEVLFCDRKNIPEIIGIVKGSPASHGNLQRGDIITKINGIIVKNRPQVRDIMSIIQQRKSGSITIEVRRAGKHVDTTIDLDRFSYPYSPDVDTHLGIVFLGTGLKIGYLESLKDIITQHGAKNVLLLTSSLVKSVLEQNLRESPFFGGKELTIEIGVPQHNFFGGNICIGDLLVVQDYIDYITDYEENGNTRPDLVVIPSSPFNLSGWGRDLTGRVYLDIERQTGIPVEILACQTIYD